MSPKRRCVLGGTWFALLVTEQDLRLFLPMGSNVNLLTPGCSREKCSIYGRVSNKESRAANTQKA